MDSNNQNSKDLVSMNNTFVVTTVTPELLEVTESNTKAMETTFPTDPPKSTIDEENRTQVINPGNSSSTSIAINEGEEQQTSDSMTTHTSILNASEADDSTVTSVPLTTNITSIFTELLAKSSKSLNLTDYTNDETNDSSSFITDVNNETSVKTSNITEESNSWSTELSAFNNLNANNTSTTQNSQLISSISPEMTETTQFNEINSRQTIETSTHKPSAETTQGIQTTTINTYIEMSSRPKIEESAQITEIPIKSSERQTVGNPYNITEISGNPINQN